MHGVVGKLFFGRAGEVLLCIVGKGREPIESRREWI